MKKRFLSLVLVIALALTLSPCVFAAVSSSTLAAAVNGTAKYIYSSTPSPQVGSVGGEWAVLGLARSGYSVPEKYYRDYYATVVKYVKDRKGVLHDKKYTEYSRLIVALSAIGADARNVGGYDLTLPLGDYEKTIWQGLNGPIWALIALDSGDYPMPQNPEAEIQATRQMYIDRILACQLPDGGWSLLGGTSYATDSDNTSDPDITGMALQALAKYQNQNEVAVAIPKALDCMSKMQALDGGFSSMGDANAESIAQIIVALCELGISPDDSRFVKNGNSLLDALLTFRQSDGSFQHTASGSGNNQMTSEQGFYALVAALRLEKGMNSLYRMGDAISIGDAPPVEVLTPSAGLPGKNKDVTPRSVSQPGITFSDVKNSPNKAAIEALAAREIINGMGDGTFAPEATMTRAQYATIVVKALGLTSKANSKFKDVPANAWYAAYVGTANTYGIVKGVSDAEFNPNGTITRQEAAVMTVRAAKLCGLDTAVGETEITDILCDFMDYRTVASWAKENMAWCYKTGVLDDTELNVEPKREILRGEVAEILYRMLVQANLI